MFKHAVYAMLVACSTFMGAASAEAGRRIALVVGVNEFDPNVKNTPKLKALVNPVADARAVAAILENELKFDVVELLVEPSGSATGKSNHDTIRGAWNRLGETLGEGKGDVDVVLFYFAGHGVEAGGKNYLLARDSQFDPSDVSLLRESALNLQEMIGLLGARQEKNNTLGIFIVDACRDNPFWADATGATVSEIGPVRDPQKVFVMYSASIGQTALDGKPGGNSLYTTQLLPKLKEYAQNPAISLADFAQSIRYSVYSEAFKLQPKHKQSPAYYDQLEDSVNIFGKRITPAVHKLTDGEKMVVPAGSLEAKDVLIECKHCPELVVLEGGTTSFQMGRVDGDSAHPAEEPQHVVKVLKKIAIGKYHITNQEWDDCVEAGKEARKIVSNSIEGCKGSLRTSSKGKTFGRLPVTDVSWDDARDYARWLSKVTDSRYRLPTEAEWEYAARGGETKPTKFSFGDEKLADDVLKLCEYGNGADQQAATLFYSNACDDRYGRTTAPVGSFKPNAFKLHDMHGNAWQWVEDCWHASYAGFPKESQENSAKAWAEQPNCTRRVVRGGSWRSGPDAMRSSARNAFAPSHRRASVGFRVVRDVD